MPKRSRLWERAETLAAFNLYCKMPSNKISKHNEEIITLAKQLNRTPRAIEMKMRNLQWHDPDNKDGLWHSSKLDKNIWKEFFDDTETIIYESEEARAYFDGKTMEEKAVVEYKMKISELEEMKIPELEERQRVVRVRVNQGFFRRSVLSSYDEKCCITGLAVVELLNASHIIPWREKRSRLDPRNGLCLNVLHDRAFDRGLMTILPDGEIVISKYLRKQANKCDESAFIADYESKTMYMPDKFRPKKEFLEYHNNKIYKR